MRLIVLLALLGNVVALAWLVYMVVTYVPLAREWPVVCLMAAFPLLNIVALAGLLRGGKS